MSQQTPTNTTDLPAAPSAGATTNQGGTPPATDVVRSGASAVGSEAKDRVVDLRDTAQDEVRTVVHDARDQAARVVASTRDQLRHQAGEQAGALARTLRDIGDQLSKMADGSDDEGSEVVRLVRGVADQATRSADHLDQGGVDALMGDLTRTARTRPGLFLLGSVAAGFGVGRLVRHLDTSELTSAAREAVQGGDVESSGDDASAMPSGVSAAGEVPAMASSGTGGSVLDTSPPPPPPPPAPSTAGWTQTGGTPSTGVGS